jgi:hypothetical protein
MFEHISKFRLFLSFCGIFQKLYHALAEHMWKQFHRFAEHTRKRFHCTLTQLNEFSRMLIQRSNVESFITWTSKRMMSHHFLFKFKNKVSVQYNLTLS